MALKHDNFCSYRLSMLGKQMIKQYILHERRKYVRKLWGSFIWFLIFSVLTAICFMPNLVHMEEYSDFLMDLSPIFVVFALIFLLGYFMLLHSGHRRQLGRSSDLRTMKNGGYKVDTIYVAGAYRPRGKGFGSTALKSFLEGHKDYAIGTISGRSVHALNLTGEMLDNVYRPCIMLDNNSTFILPRTAVVAPKN